MEWLLPDGIGDRDDALEDDVVPAEAQLGVGEFVLLDRGTDTKLFLCSKNNCDI